MKLNEMKTNDELITGQRCTDADFRREYERTVLGRAVAVAVVRYRAAHDLSQRDLAQRLGMKQPQVARLELGEFNPSMDTLMRIASHLQIEFTIDVRPAGSPARNVTKHAQTDSLVGRCRTDEAELLVAAR
jgi:transcriptional regulator with XRE-family HTH domain